MRLIGTEHTLVSVHSKRGPSACVQFVTMVSLAVVLLLLLRLPPTTASSASASSPLAPPADVDGWWRTNLVGLGPVYSNTSECNREYFSITSTSFTSSSLEEDGSIVPGLVGAIVGDNSGQAGFDGVENGTDGGELPHPSSYHVLQGDAAGGGGYRTRAWRFDGIPVTC